MIDTSNLNIILLCFNILSINPISAIISLVLSEITEMIDGYGIESCFSNLSTVSKEDLLSM